MIYDESDKTDFSNCEQCFQPFGKYYWPKLLTCYGKTMCNTCIQHIVKEVHDDKCK